MKFGAGAMWGLLGLLLGCQQDGECTDDPSCVSQVRVDLVPAVTAPGEYLVEIRADSTTWSCEFLLPVARFSTNCGSSVMLPVFEQGFRGFELLKPVEAMTISIKRDGQQVFSEEVRPNYVSVNHPCFPGCRGATVTLETPPDKAFTVSP